jgi:hypothetical protein
MILWICGHCGAERVFRTDEEADEYSERHHEERHSPPSPPSTATIPNRNTKD